MAKVLAFLFLRLYISILVFLHVLLPGVKCLGLVFT